MSDKSSLKLLAMSLLFFPAESFAEDTVKTPVREGYSFFGLGFDVLDYEENTTPKIDGSSIDIETSSGLNFTQQSGAYVAVNKNWGFYLASASTLGESSSDEEWLIDEVSVRTNKVAFERQRLSFLASRHIGELDYLLLGAQYGSNEFKRFAAKLTPEAAGFGIDETTFSAGTVSEKVWDLSLVAGYETNTIFATKAPGWRYQMQYMVGVPLINSITNTEVDEGKSVSENFNGFQLRFNGVYGYQFNQNTIAAVAVELGYSRRNQINQDFSDASGVTEFPENNLLYFYPSFTVYWSF